VVTSSPPPPPPPPPPLGPAGPIGEAIGNRLPARIHPPDQGQAPPKRGRGRPRKDAYPLDPPPRNGYRSGGNTPYSSLGNINNGAKVAGLLAAASVITSTGRIPHRKGTAPAVASTAVAAARATTGATAAGGATGSGRPSGGTAVRATSGATGSCG
ncbi:unnamed protein product, partial [Sphacelaria rigidula]